MIAKIFSAKVRAMWTKTSFRTGDLFVQRIQEFYSRDKCQVSNGNVKQPREDAQCYYK